MQMDTMKQHQSLTIWHHSILLVYCFTSLHDRRTRSFQWMHEVSNSIIKYYDTCCWKSYIYELMMQMLICVLYQTLYLIFLILTLSISKIRVIIFKRLSCNRIEHIWQCQFWILYKFSNRLLSLTHVLYQFMTSLLWIFLIS